MSLIIGNLYGLLLCAKNNVDDNISYNFMLCLQNAIIIELGSK